MGGTASIPTSVDAHVAGPDDGPGLGRGGQRLHHLVMGGPWTDDSEPETFATEGAGKEFMDDVTGLRGGHRPGGATGQHLAVAAHVRDAVRR